MRGFLLFILITFSLNLFATYQIQDTLEYQGKKYTLLLGKNAFSCSPLSLYYAQKNIKAPFKAWSSAVSRNHIATWIVKDNRFYLKSINTIDGQKTFEECLVKSEDTTYNTASLLFADWFSGVVTVGDYCFKIKYGKIIHTTKYDCGVDKYNFFTRLLACQDSIKMGKDYGYLDIGYYKQNPVFDYYGEEGLLDFPYNWESDSLFGVPFCKWEIKKKKLYLKHLELYSFSKSDTIDIQKEFSDKKYKNAVFADWVNGIYRIKIGEMTIDEDLKEIGLGPYFKVLKYRYLKIRKGKIINSVIVDIGLDRENPLKGTPVKLLQLIKGY